MAGLSGFMSFKQFVEFGRLCVVSFGPHADKLAVVVDIIDDKRVLVDICGEDGKQASREVLPVKRIRLTDFATKIERGASQQDVAAAVKADKLAEKFQQTNWGKKMAAARAKGQMNDFQRFKWARLAAKRDELVKAELAKH